MKMNGFPIMLLGDIHGYWTLINKQVERLGLSYMNIFQIGDFGIGFRGDAYEIKRLHDLNNFLFKFDITLWVIRGNHDDPSYFNGDHMYSNLKLLPDYTILEWKGQRILCVGGALSVDREGRREGIDYWCDENFVFRPDRVMDKKIDHIFAHTAPYMCHPVNIFFNDGNIDFVSNSFLDGWFAHDSLLKDELIKERLEVGKLIKKVKENNDLQSYVYGHFHESNKMKVDGTIYRLLDINEFADFNKILR